MAAGDRGPVRAGVAHGLGSLPPPQCQGAMYLVEDCDVVSFDLWAWGGVSEGFVVRCSSSQVVEFVSCCISHGCQGSTGQSTVI